MRKPGDWSWSRPGSVGDDDSDSLRARAVAGAWRGLRWGALLGLYVSIMDVVGHGRALRDLGASLPGMIWAYLLGGVLAGTLLALLRPLRQAWWGRLVSGVVAGTAGGFVLIVALRPEGSLAAHAITAVLFGVSVGGLSGLLWLRR